MADTALHAKILLSKPLIHFIGHGMPIPGPECEPDVRHSHDRLREAVHRLGKLFQSNPAQLELTMVPFDA